MTESCCNYKGVIKISFSTYFHYAANVGNSIKEISHFTLTRNQQSRLVNIPMSFYKFHYIPFVGKKNPIIEPKLENH